MKVREDHRVLRSRVPAPVLIACLVLCLLLAMVPGQAEVSVGGTAPSPSFLLASPGGEDGDPIPFFSLVRQGIDPDLALNPLGDDNGDGPGAFVIDPTTGNPVVTWGWWDGHDHEIVYSRWTGSSWGPWQQVTDNEVDDEDPAIAMTGNGALRLTWWRTENGHRTVWYRDLALEDSSAEEVTPLPRAGSRPGIATWGGDVKVAFQHEEAGVREVRVATRSTGWSDELVATTTFAGPAGDGDIDVQVHALAGHLWVDWLDAEGRLAWSEWLAGSGEWSAPRQESYSWGGASGETEPVARDRARARIRLHVLRGD